MQHIQLEPFLPGYDTRMTVLDNGLTIVTENIPNARSVGMMIKMYSGTALAPRGKRGAPHILEHLLAAQDTDEDGVSLLNRFCKKYGYPPINATDGGYINTYGLGPGKPAQPQRVRPHHALEYMEQLLKELMDPGFSERQFVKEKAAIDEELRGRIRSAGYDGNILWDTMFKTDTGIEPSWLGRRDLIDLAELGGIKLDDVIAHHANNYGPNRATIIMAGAVNHDEVVARIAKLTENWKPVTPLVRHELEYQPTEFRWHDVRKPQARRQVGIELWFPMLAHSSHHDADVARPHHHMLARSILADAIQLQLRGRNDLVYSAGVSAYGEDMRIIAAALTTNCDVGKIPAVAEGFAKAIEYSLQNADRLIQQSHDATRTQLDLLEPSTVDRVQELTAFTLLFGKPVSLQQAREARLSFNADQYAAIIRAVYGQQLSVRTTADWRHMDSIPDAKFFQNHIATVVPPQGIAAPVLHVDNLTTTRKRLVQAYRLPARAIKAGKRRLAAHRAG